MSTIVAARHGRRPLFASLMSFPAACFLLTLVTDILYARSYDMAWLTRSGDLAAIRAPDPAAAATVVMP